MYCNKITEIWSLLLTIPSIPAPWSLKGKGYILLYHWNRKFLDTRKLVPEFLKEQSSGGVGAVMIVDYAESEAGPYQELLFLTNAFRTKVGKRRNIPKIFVSTMASVENGIRNWAIPKELAEFRFEQLSRNRECISVNRPGKDPFFEIELWSGGLPFPVTTSIMPMPLIQEQDGKLFHTQFGGRGLGRIARIQDCRVSDSDFPDISGIRPLAAVRVDPFNILFPVPRTENMPNREES